MKEPASESAERMRRVSRKLYKDMLEVGQPIVCALNGPAIGAGCSLALLCDFVLASSAVTRSRANSRAATGLHGIVIGSPGRIAIERSENSLYNSSINESADREERHR